MGNNCPHHKTYDDMSEFKKYMLLRLRNGGMMYEHLIPKIAKKNNVIKKISEDEGVDIKFIKKGHNIGNPIPYTTLSNMLISLIGGIPVPTKPNKSNGFPVKRIEACDEMAKNSYYKIESPIDPDNVFIKQIVGEDGEYYGIVNNGMNNCGGEFMQSRKAAINSNRGGETIFYFDENGEKISAPGTYDFSMLLRLFNDNEKHPGYVRFISFLNEILNINDVRTTYTFGEVVHLLHNMSSDESYIEKVGKFYNEMVSLWDKGGNQSAWFYNIFRYGKPTATSNTDLGDGYGIDGTITKTYLRNNIGDKIKRISVNGQIIVPIYDEKIYELLLNGKGFCTFLDGGICEVAGFYNEKNEFWGYYETEWTKIH